MVVILQVAAAGTGKILGILGCELKKFAWTPGFPRKRPADDLLKSAERK
jgi:hypothetical protein